MRRLGTALALALAAAALAAPTAGASSATIDPQKTLKYTAAAGEANHLRIYFDASNFVYVLEDTGVSSISVSGEGCYRYTSQIVYCGFGKFAKIDAKLGDGGSYANDELSLTTVTIHGGSQPDTLIAGPGGATMNGGKGKATYQGSPDPDTVNARNGVAESVTCGGATDGVNADTDDTVAADCENVTRGEPVTPADPPVDPTGGPLTGPISATAVTAPVAVSPTTVTLDARNRVPVGVSCRAGTPGGCQGVVTLSYPAGGGAKGKVTAARRQRRVVGRSRRFRIAAGRKAVVPVKLSRRGVRIFNRRKRGHKRRVKLSATVAVRTEAGVKTTRSTITVKARRRPPTARRTRR